MDLQNNGVDFSFEAIHPHDSIHFTLNWRGWLNSFP